jgi:hypothetical protein
MIWWLYTWASALPWPARAVTLARSAFTMARATAGASRSSQANSVGPMLNEMRSKLSTMSRIWLAPSTRRAAVFGA